MPPKPQLIDMIRTVPEVAVRLWAGGQARSIGDQIEIKFPDRPEEGSIRISPEALFAAERVVLQLRVRWMNRMLRSMNDLLELRHAAEDVYIMHIFRKEAVPSALFVPAGVTASGYYRAMIPADLANEGSRVLSNWTSSVEISKILRYDILWIQLLTSPVLNQIVKMARSQGVKVVYDIDDRLDDIPKENQASTVYDEAKQAEIRDMIDMADMVTVSTEPLARSIRSRHPGKLVKVLPNMLPANVIPRRHTPNPKVTRILWAGSPTHKRDLAIVAPALRNILRKNQGKVRFTCFGERVPEALADCQDWIDMKDPVDFEEYHDALASIGADFGIAPLEVNTFNESKSAIKALEYAAAGYPMLLSPVGEYPSVVADGLPAVLVSDEQWEVAIERMIEMSLADRDALGKRCTDWVCAHRCIGKTKGAKWADAIVELSKMDVSRVEEPEKPFRLVEP